jgi:hypothetical protein
MSPHHSLELLPQYRRLQEVVTIDLRKELRAQLCALDSLYPQNYRSGISMLMYGRGGRARRTGSCRWLRGVRLADAYQPFGDG